MFAYFAFVTTALIIACQAKSTPCIYCTSPLLSTYDNFGQDPYYCTAPLSGYLYSLDGYQQLHRPSEQLCLTNVRGYNCRTSCGTNCKCFKNNCCKQKCCGHQPVVATTANCAYCDHIPCTGYSSPAGCSSCSPSTYDCGTAPINTC